MLTELENLSSNAFFDAPFNVFICGPIHDERSIYLTNKISSNRPNVICLSIDSDFNNEDLPKNIKAIPAGKLTSVLSEAITSECLEIALDISSIGPALMGEVLEVISDTSKLCRIKLYVGYSVSNYFAPENAVRINQSINVVSPFFSGWSDDQSYRTSTIVGLGYEPCKAEGALEYFDAKEQWIFIPKSTDEKYYLDVKSNNESIIDRLSESQHIVEYDVTDPAGTFSLLEQIISNLLQNTNPLLMPFGPKIFLFISMLQALCHPELGVWAVSSSSSEALRKSTPSGEVVCLFCEFS